MSDPDLFRYKADVLRVVDGDTFEALIDLGFSIKVQASVRILWMNAPEMTGSTKAHGEASKMALERLLKSGPVRIRTEKPDSFGRALAEVWVGSQMSGWLSVWETMVRQGYAAPKPRKGGGL